MNIDNRLDSVANVGWSIHFDPINSWRNEWVAFYNNKPIEGISKTEQMMNIDSPITGHYFSLFMMKVEDIRIRQKIIQSLNDNSNHFAAVAFSYHNQDHLDIAKKDFLKRLSDNFSLYEKEQINDALNSSLVIQNPNTTVDSETKWFGNKIMTVINSFK